MKQSYKIYINNVAVILAQHKLGFEIPKHIQSVTVYHINKLINLKKLITALEIGSIQENLIILSEDIAWLHDNFFANFRLIQAGGGLVVNNKGEYLMMFRKKKWDLPKGKLEKDEKSRDGAIREVEEETGVKVLNADTKLGTTYHTYKLKDKWVLKKTTWYLMVGDTDSKLKPQAEEDIEKVEWLGKKEVKEKLKNSYISIKDVFDFYKKYKK